MARDQSSTQPDPYAWLEDVTGEQAMAWVRERNAETDAGLASSAEFVALEADITAVLDSDEKLPLVEKIGDLYYNFWQDAEHVRGVWRRTTLAEYRTNSPAWETVIDLDELNESEGANWVWHGADALRPDFEYALIALSRGGSDADVTREFNLKTLQWRDDGFTRPEAKGGVGWIDGDTVFVATDFGEGSMTTLGYPRTVREWRRGQPLDDATLVHECEPDDMSVSAMHDSTPGFERSFVVRRLAFYRDELYLRTAHDSGSALVKIEVPDSADKNVHRSWLTLRLRDDWTIDGNTYVAGSLVACDFDGWLERRASWDVVFAPTETSSLEGYAWTRNHLVLNVLDNVQSRISVMTPTTNGWHARELTGLPELCTASVWAVDSVASDDVWLVTTGYLTPTTFALVELGDAWAPIAPPQPLKAMPAFFDASTHVVEQHHATSKDGTSVPYFLVRPRDLPYDGTTPTVLYGYGGFEISLTPAYSGVVGRGWLKSGGAYAVANIRGGGEFGPRWHKAAFRANRHLAYQDFAAVAQDLATSRVTSPAHLGIEGGSNGGLLVGNMLTQYPDLFGAIVIAVPLLDMYRYSHLLAGASWMAEYGDPDTDDWEFIKTFSPYHLHDAEATYPPVLIWTTTRDDRVHPGHARKMMAKMAAAADDVRYYENVEGGHGSGSTTAQTAHVEALTYQFFADNLR